MNQPVLKFVDCPSTLAQTGGAAPAPHRMAYWEWNATGNPLQSRLIVCVHGLTRQGRDFDVLAQALSQQARVVCPDVMGRGRSDWLADPQGYQIPQYAADMLCLLGQLQAQAPITSLDWVGTSMGGLIGLALTGTPGLPLPVPVRRLVLNDIGPELAWPALQRIGQYLGDFARFDSLQEAADTLRAISSGFGPHSAEQWLELSRHMVKPCAEGGLTLHYDPAIAHPFNAITQDAAALGNTLLWQLYDATQARTLLLRGAQSDLLARETALAMAQRGPRASLVEFDAIGHAPTLVTQDQVHAVTQFLWAPEG